MASSRKKPAKKAAPKKTKLGQRLLKAAKEAREIVRTRNVAKVKPEDVSETCLHKHCQQWLEKSGIWSRLLIFHVPNERKGGIGAIMHFKRMGVRTGVADYLAFRADRSPTAIELKDADGEQRGDQVDFENDWKAAGGVYFVVRTLDEFKAVINGLLMFGG